MKKTLLFFVILTLFFVRLPDAFATTTSEIFPTGITGGSFCDNWVNCLNLVGTPDNIYATLTSAQASMGMQYAGFSTIPSAATITGLTFKEYGNSSGNGGTNRLSFNGGSTDFCKNSSSPGDPQVPEFPFANGVSTLAISPSNCLNFNTNMIPANLNPAFVVAFTNDGSRNANADTFSVQATYVFTPTLNISSLVASSGAQTITFNASGDTTFTQAGEKCKISLFQYDISNPSAPVIVTGGVAYVLLDANNPRTTTLFQGQSTYLGYGFTSTVSTWEADHIIMPYFNNKNTDIRAYTSCYHQTTNSDGSLSAPIYDVQYQALDASSPINYAKSLIATPSALTNVTGYSQPQCTSLDIICQIVQNVQVGLNQLFAPNQTIDDADFSSINNAMLSRAPFAYGLAALNTNTNITPVSSTAATSLSFDFSNITGVPIPTKYQHMSYSDTGAIQSNVFAPLRPYEVIILWVLLLLYIVMILRSIFV